MGLVVGLNDVLGNSSPIRDRDALALRPLTDPAGVRTPRLTRSPGMRFTGRRGGLSSLNIRGEQLQKSGGVVFGEVDDVIRAVDTESDGVHLLIGQGRVIDILVGARDQAPAGDRGLAFSTPPRAYAVEVTEAQTTPVPDQTLPPVATP